MLEFKGRTVEKVAVIGSGQIGPDIALYFTKVFAPHDVPVVVVDVVEDALDAGRKKLHAKIDKGVEAGAFKAEFAAAMKDNVLFTTDYNEAKGASFVVEAASESKDIKGKIFAQLDGLCPADAVFASNSSHLEPEVIFADLPSKQRAMVNHFFFPAERNPIVEVVPGAETDTALADWVMALYEWMGKVPIRVGSRYGYAIDPIFEGIFLAAALCVEEGLGSTKEVDSVARKALGLGVGPFTAMNLTGGNPITLEGLKHYNTKIMSWFDPPKLLVDAVEKKTAWDVPGRGEKIQVDPDTAATITKRMRGAYFGLACEILESGITNVADLNMALQMALVVKPAFTMMNEIGVAESLALVEAYAADHDGFVVADVLKKQAASGAPWEIPVVLREDRGDVAVVTVRRPDVLNAINAEAIRQLAATFEAIATDDAVKAVVVTGYGKKAFVSGADIGFLSTLESPEDGTNMCLNFQGAVQVIEDMEKPVVCAMNGIAFGGGCEIAMGCHARVAPKGLRVLAGQPEVKLGIIPGAGGSQRLPRIVGFEKGSELLRTGRPISSEEAHEIGLVDRLSDGDVVADAIAFAREIAAGEHTPKPMPAEPLSPPDALPEVDLGHLSTAVDAILCRAIVDGGRMTLADGLVLEAKLFGEVCKTEDKKIGIANFIEKGARSKAEFVNR